MQDNKATVWTIGHSTHSFERFLELLRAASITAIADVRTAPFSRHFPQFNKETLQGELRIAGVAYSFLGKELGGRPKSSLFYCDGVADYERMAQSPEFAHGLQRVLDGARKYHIALMCSEIDPLDCHRCLLVGRGLARREVVVRHILASGVIMDHSKLEEQLLKFEGQQADDLFLSPDERLAAAYRKRARRVAYAEQPDVPESHTAAE